VYRVVDKVAAISYEASSKPICFSHVECFPLHLVLTGTR
jgi:hypothetical protein